MTGLWIHHIGCFHDVSLYCSHGVLTLKVWMFSWCFSLLLQWCPYYKSLDVLWCFSLLLSWCPYYKRYGKHLMLFYPFILSILSWQSSGLKTGICISHCGLGSLQNNPLKRLLIALYFIFGEQNMLNLLLCNGLNCSWIA